MKQTPGETRYKFLGVLISGVVWIHLTAEQQYVVACAKYCQPGKSAEPPSPGFAVGAQQRRHAVLACMTDFSYPSPHRAETNVHHKSFCEHNLSDQTGTSWITASDTHKHRFQVSIPRTQSSSPKSWPTVSPEDSLLLGVCRIRATLSC